MTALSGSVEGAGSERLRSIVREHAGYIALIALVLFNLAFTPNFATLRNVQLQMVQVAPVVIVGLGMALVIGTEGIDLSVGAVRALAAAMVALFVGQSPRLAVAMALVAGVMAGLLNGTLVAYLRIQPIIACLLSRRELRRAGEVAY